jgi:hypothetical protein
MDLPSTRAVLALLLAALGTTCGKLRGLDTKNACASSADCKPGNVCMAGVCGLPVEGGPGDGTGDRPTDDADGSSGPSAGADADAHADADADADALVPPDQGPPPPADPCDAIDAPTPQPARAVLVRSLIGAWRLCPAHGSGGNIAWLAGPSGRIQLTATNWSPLIGDGAGGWRAIPRANGVYYFLLEAPVHVVHFANRVAGVDVAVTTSAATNAITLTECDGVTRCSGPSTRLIAMPPIGVVTPDAKPGASDASSQ